MPVFISPNGNPEVWGEKPSGYFTQEEWDEIHSIIMPVPTTEELEERVRDERDARITACDWVISRHAEQVALSVDTTLTSDEYTAWLTYRQELRDLPSVTGFPWDGGSNETPWPTEPTI